MSQVVSKSAKRKTIPRSNGSKLKAIVKNNVPSKKGDKGILQWKRSFLKKESENHPTKGHYQAADLRELIWFKMFVGKLVYVLSESGFNGVLEIVNEEHAKQLYSEAQDGGYRFISMTKRAQQVCSPESEQAVIDFDSLIKKVREIREDLDEFGIVASNTEGLSKGQYEVYRYLFDKTFAQLRNDFNILLSTNLPNQVRIEAFNRIKLLPTGEQLVKQAEDYTDSVIKEIDNYRKEAEYDNSGLTIANSLFEYVLMPDQPSDYTYSNYTYIDMLQQFQKLLMNPIVSTIFFEHTEKKPETVANRLNDLIYFFRNLSEDSCRAELDRMFVDTYGESMSPQELERIKETYIKKRAVEKVKYA